MNAIRSRRAWVAVAVTVMAGMTGRVYAATITIQPSSQDAYISKDRPNRIAGANPTNTRIRVLASPPNTQVRRGLVQFSLASIPKGSTISSAVVELNAAFNANNPTLIHGLHRITTGWLQSAVKWNNQPPFLAPPTATAVVGNGLGFKSFPVTPDVQAAVNLCVNDHGWVIKDEAETATNDQVNYTALEEHHPGELADRPKLTVTFTRPPCATNADCADTNFCTMNERCEGGVCVVDALNCDDGDPCTDDICDCDSGCINANVCNDGFSCTIDTCNPATQACTYTKVDSACATQCSTGTCVGDPDSTTIDPDTGCAITSTSPNGTPCNDGDLCSSGDQCQGGTCSGTPVVCSPLGQCYLAGTCDPQTGLCSNPTKSPGEACSDGSLCTAPDQCDGLGTCVGGTPVVCSALDQCHDVGTCNPGTGLCSNPPKGSGSPCDDGSRCTQTDQCNGAGACVGADPVVCTPLGVCYDAGTCNPGTGTCSNPPKGAGAPCPADGNPCTDDVCDGGGSCGVDNTSSCNDGNACTQTDTCAGGSCVGGNPVVCTALGECYDVGICDTGTGSCSNPPRASGTPCTPDGNPCTDDQCDGAGVCGVNNTAPCSDGNACTQSDQCAAGGCVPGAPVVCTPLDQCHVAGTCDTGTGVCDNPIQANGTGCDDGNTCTLSDACLGGTCQGNPITCGDGIVQASCGEECDEVSDNCTAQCQFVCGPVPEPNCRQPALAAKSSLLVKNKTPDKRDVLQWKWNKGSATDVTDFGEPLGTARYTLCLWDDSALAQPRLLAVAPPAGVCPTKPCWKTIKGGFKYKDKDADPDGLTQVLLKSGTATKAKVQVKGKGVNLQPPALPLDPPVTVQLRNDQGVCWETKFSSPSKNLADQFRSRSD